MPLGKTKNAPSAWQQRCTSSSARHCSGTFWLACRPDDISATARAITAAAGVLGFLVFGYLALKQLPRPYLARQDLELQSDERGEVVVEPRALERIAEAAARSNTVVTSASGRYGGDDLMVDLSIRSARELADSCATCKTASAARSPSTRCRRCASTSPSSA